LTFVGIAKIGTARSQPLRHSYLLWSALIAISFRNEQSGPGRVSGTNTRSLGVALITGQAIGKLSIAAAGTFFTRSAREFSPAFLSRSAGMVCDY
jgi:drug/metabolite transporter (DMT)-like permease